MKKRLKGLISVFFFLLCIFAWKSGQEVRAAENEIRDFSRIFYIPAGAVLKGGSLQKLQEIYDSMSCIAYTEDGEELYLDAIWDYSGIDIQTVGAYKITGTVRLPEGYTSNVGLPEWTAWISVQNPGQPEIQVYSRMISAGIYYFPWITEQNPDIMEIWLQKEGEDWVNVSEEGYGFADTDGMYLSGVFSKHSFSCMLYCFKEICRWLSCRYTKSVLCDFNSNYCSCIIGNPLYV